MKLATTILLYLLLIGCGQPNEKPTAQKEKPPRIEFIECSGWPDASLERKTYFNKNVDIAGDTTTISFDFAQDCCLEFVGKWELEKEVLTLSYHLKDQEQLPCDCKCVYTMKYHFNNKDYSWYRVKIRKGKEQ